MKVFENFQLFWDEFQVGKANQFGFHDWEVVRVLHTSDAEYAQQLQAGTDPLGFQPLSVTVASPISQQTKQYLVKQVTDHTAGQFRAYCRSRYQQQLAARFGSFRPDTFTAFTEYDDWDSFYKVWLERDGKPVFNHNIPLLFDHTPRIEYWTRKQTGLDVLPYQRLLVTTYFVSQGKFYDFFIKDIDDAAMQQIALLVQSRIGINIDMLLKADLHRAA